MVRRKKLEELINNRNQARNKTPSLLRPATEHAVNFSDRNAETSKKIVADKSG